MKKYILFFITLVLLSLPTTRVSAAGENVAGQAAQLVVAEKPIDTRISHLRAYLESHGSPLAIHAQTFIEEADKNNLDWRLVAAIAGLESTFGKRIPAYSYNAWGWGIPTGASSGIGFEDWDHGIATVSQGLKSRYIDRGAITLDQIGSIYAASPTWSVRVAYFMERISRFAPASKDLLEITI